MMVSVDLQRRALLRVVEDIDGADVAPGSVMVLRRQGRDDAPPAGYGMRCPGCGQEAYLPLAPANPNDSPTTARWNVDAGDVRTGAGVTLSPSVWHRSGCGWHGWLRNGVWEPC